MDLTHLIETYGYWALLIGILLEGETILVVAAFLAKRGYLDLHWVIFISFAATYFTDQLLFHIGRHRGIPILTKRPGWDQRVNSLRRWLNRNQNLVIVGFRFVYGFRTVTPYMLGVFKLPVKKYLILNGIGGLVWATVVAYLGYGFGMVIEEVLDNVKQAESIILALMIVASIGLAIWHQIRRIKAKSIESSATED